MKVIYTRCSSAHYFRGSQCPFDGWSHAEWRELERLRSELDRLGIDPTIAELAARGLSVELLGRILVVEFGDPATSFEAAAISHFFIDGQLVAEPDLGPEFS